MKLSKNEQTFTDCYCEENVFLLCQKIKKEFPNQLQNCKVIFMSSEDEKLPIWNQTGINKLTIWGFQTIHLTFRLPRDFNSHRK
jgi:protein N-terminal glutamine amidohydrolase